ncbi:hypothetical protein IC229_13370 [Spirosoma sp. BT702]|uniref:Uncharacterized protein n=1 Tax=Spirosoma profusum TaxID=2771354 RepID=A0A926XWX5_9BACT|nr:hypothetical protein [Spirosoma profusum]MBD2701635.1 hypothetical protein [Spirosoma profusum]
MTALALHRLRINDVCQWSDKVFSATYLLRPHRFKFVLPVEFVGNQDWI